MGTLPGETLTWQIAAGLGCGVMNQHQEYYHGVTSSGLGLRLDLNQAWGCDQEFLGEETMEVRGRLMTKLEHTLRRANIYSGDEVGKGVADTSRDQLQSGKARWEALPKSRRSEDA